MKICFWCKEVKEYDGSLQPEYFDYDYCVSCKEKVDSGIVLIQITNNINGNPPIVDGLYPTGLWCVVKVDDVRKVLHGWAGLDDAINTGRMFVNVVDWIKLGLPES